MGVRCHVWRCCRAHSELTCASEVVVPAPRDMWTKSRPIVSSTQLPHRTPVAYVFLWPAIPKPSPLMVTIPCYKSQCKQA